MNYLKPISLWRAGLRRTGRAARAVSSFCVQVGWLFEGTTVNTQTGAVASS